MSNFNKVKSKIKQFANDKALNDKVIRKIKGSYHLYNIYKITNNNGLWEVRKHEQFIYSFESSSTATTWCLADKSKQYMDAHNLIVIDKRIQDKKQQASMRTKQISQAELSYDIKDIAIARITYDLDVCRNLKTEIDNYYSKRINTHNLQDFKI